MTTPQAPLTPEQRLAAEQQAKFARMTRNLAIGGLVFCPLVALLPPRKLDFYTYSLAVGFYLSVDHLSEIHTGRGLLLHLGTGLGFGSKSSTEQPQELQKVLKEEREKSRKMLERPESEPEPESMGVMGALRKIWMGDEQEGWKARRTEEQKKAFEEGKTYTDLIVGQISDVVNWDKKKSGNDEKGDKKE